MAKARAIVKRRKAVRNIKKITKTMQMIATAKFQKSLKRAVGTKPYTKKVRELVRELAASLGGSIDHPLLRLYGASRLARQIEPPRTPHVIRAGRRQPGDGRRRTNAGKCQQPLVGGLRP